MFIKKIILVLLFVSLAISPFFVQTPARGQTPPYPPSPVVTNITFDWSSHDRRAEGSDNWALTWADDNHKYTPWGDGGGFGGTISDGRVSLGIARIEGLLSSYRGGNVWGGKNPLNNNAWIRSPGNQWIITSAENSHLRLKYPVGTARAKSYGILSVSGNLYMLAGPGSGAESYKETRLFQSTNHGVSWSPASWAFHFGDGIFLPTFLQFGKGYQGARDDFVYIYAPERISTTWEVQKPGKISLWRVP